MMFARNSPRGGASTADGNVDKRPRLNRALPHLARRLAVERLEDRRLLAVLFSHDADDTIRAISPSEAAYNNFGLDWIGGSEPFDDSAWQMTSGTTNGVGYDRGDAYDAMLGLDLESSMHGARSTLFARAEFNVADPSAVDRLTLNLRYDDGFIAWLNGVEVARANADSVYPAWSATATAEHQASTTAFETFDLAAAIASLQTGTNILAIRGLNLTAADDDALIQFTLVGESRTGPPLAVNDAATAQENTPVFIDVLANDEEGSDAIDPSSVAIATPPAHGTAVANPDGTITYTPSTAYNGPDSFTYTVRDNTGTGATVSQTLVASNAAVRAFVPANNNLGTTWRGADEPFNDTGWQSGTLGVGYDTNASPTDFTPQISLNVRTALQNVNTTIYMRSGFSVADRNDVLSLTLRMRYDDGFVAFINGVQVASAFAPSSLTYNSASAGETRPDADALVFQTFDLSPFLSALKTGPNVLAIHGLNQSLASSDLLMQPELVAMVDAGGRQSNAATVTVNVSGVDFPPIARSDTYSVDEGKTLIVSGGSGTTLTPGPGQILWPVSAGGNGHVYESVEISDLTWPQARALAESRSLSGVYGRLATVTSAAELAFLSANLPAMDSWLGGYQDFAAPGYSEPSGGWRWITGEPWQFTNWESSEPNDAAPGESYLDMFGGGGREFQWNDARTDQTHNVMWVEYSPGLAPEPTDTVLIAANEVWQFRDNGVAPPNDAQGDSWKQTAFDDSGWAAGAAQLGYGDGDEGTVVDCGSSRPSCNSNNHITTWFRKHFTLEPGIAARATALTIELMRDDAAAVYINGVEIIRSNLPGVLGDNAVTPQTLASAVATTADESTFQPPETRDLTLQQYRNLLRDGDNVIAVEVHQNDANSSDVTFDLRMSLTVAVSGGVLGNDTEPDGQAMTAVLGVGPVHGTLDFYPNGTFTYTPNASFVGIDTFTYRSSDGLLSSEPATVTLTVNHVPPIAANETYETDEDTPLVIGIAQGVLANDSDTQNHPLTAIVDAFPLSGTLTLQSDGSFVYTPAANFHGVDTFSYLAADGQRNSAAATVTITVDSVDDPPVADDDSYSGVEGQTLIVDGRVGPTTTATDFLGLEAVGTYTAPGSVSQIVFAPKYGLLFIRDGGARVRIIDVATQTQISERLPTETFTDFDVSPDDEFLFVADYGGTNIGYGSPARPSYVHRFRLATRTWETKTAPEIAYRLEAVDGDRFLLLEQDQSVDLTLNSYRSTGSPIVELSRRGGYQGNIDYVPRSTRVLYAESGLSSISIQTWTISGNTFVSGTGRGFSSGGSVVGSTDGQYFFFGGMQLLAANVQQTIRSYPNSVAAAPGGLAITSTGAIFNAANGTQLGALPYATSTFAVDEQDLHLWAFESSGNRLHHYLLPIYGRGLLANDSQPEYAIMSAEVVNGPAHGTLNLAPDGTFHYTPDTGFFGVDSFTYVATSSEGTSAPATVTLNIAHGGPTTVAEQYQIDEDGELEAPAATGVLANDSDSQNHAIVAILDTSPTNGTLTFQPDGSFRYVPTANFHGTNTFTYRASDGEIISQPVTVTIVVNSIEDLPVAVDDQFTIDRGTSLTLGAPGVAVETIAQTSFAVPATGMVNFLAAGGELGFSAPSTPSATELGVLSSDEYIVRGNTSTFTLNFDEVDISNFRQVSVRLRVRTQEDSSGSDFEENDFFRAHLGLARVGGPVVLQSIVNLSGGQLKAIDTGATGAYTTYIANIPEGFVAATLAIEASVDSSTERVFVDDIVIEGVPALGGNVLLANDTDGDGDVLSVRVVSPPMHGTISTDVNGAITYTPDPLFVGDDTFTYVANDGQSDSNVATVTIHVLLANLVPAAANDGYLINEDEKLTVSAASGVLANDIDLDGDLLAIRVVEGPAHGSLSTLPNGAFRYTPTANYSGPDAFKYVATDGRDDSAVATVSISVTAVNDAPTSNRDVYSIDAGETLDANAAATLAYRDLVMASNPMGYWRLGESNTSEPARDEIANRHGQYVGGVTVGQPGAISDGNSAARFDATSGYVNVPNSSAFNLANNFSVEAWIKPNSIGDYRRIAAFEQIGNGWAFGTRDSRLIFTTTGELDYYSPSNLVKVGQWQHIVAVFNASNDVAFYLNGGLVGQVAGSAPARSSNGSLHLGGEPIGSQFSDSFVDDIAIYNRVLAPTEIAEHYAAAMPTVADSVAEFSGTQGQDGWFYGYYNRTTDGDGVYQPANFTQFPRGAGAWSSTNFWDAGSNRWKWFNGSPPWTELLGSLVHPNGTNSGQEHWVVRRWVSDVAGPVVISGHLAKDNAGGGDGVRGLVYVNGTIVYDRVIGGADSVGVDFEVNATLASGAIVDFVLTPNGGDFADGTRFTSQIRSGSLSTTIVDVLARNSVWKYRDGIVSGSAYPSDAQGDRWIENDYDDTAWSSGPGILGFGGIDAGPIRTMIRIGPDGGGISRTALFRRTFEIENPDRIALLTLESLIDDGAAIYINGREVVRYNLPGTLGDGALRTDTLSPTTLNESSYNVFNLDLAAFPGLLVAGTNTIAVEVHQINDTSSDLGFDLSMTAKVLPDPVASGVLGNDLDAEDDAISAVVVTGPYHGALVFSNDGTFTYTPDAGFEGVDQFTYRASDGVAESAVALVTINVGAANRPPLAADDRFVARGGRSLNISAASGVLKNDFDFNGDDLTVAVFALPTRGTLALAADGGFDYTPQSNFLGVDSFTYRVADAQGTFGFATATIQVVSIVDPINGIPVAAADVFDATAGGVLNVAAPGVLADDHDPELRSLNAVVERAPWHGSLSFAADGSFTYTPTAGFSGADTFTYRATDGNTFSAPATVVINVSAAVPAGGVSPPTLPNSTPGSTQLPGSQDSTSLPGTLPTSGDLNGDGRVDRADLSIVAGEFGASSATPGYSALADLNGDGHVSIADAIALRNRMSDLLQPASSNALVRRASDRLANSPSQVDAIATKCLPRTAEVGLPTSGESPLRVARINPPGSAIARRSSNMPVELVDQVLASEEGIATALVARRLCIHRP